MLAYTHYEFDNRIRQYAETLVRRGDRVDVIALRGESGPKVEIINNVRVFKIQTRARNETGKFSYLFRLIRFFWRSMFFLAIKDMQDHYDLVHVHSVPDFEVLAAWFPKARRAKLILDIHDLLPEFYASKFHAKPDSRAVRLLLLVERISARFADHVIAANDIWRDRLLARSVKDAKCTAILNYPDGSIFCRHGRTRTDGKFIIVYPGTLNHHQGVDLAIRALARIKDQVPQAELHIYARGKETDNLSKLAGELGLAERVRFNHWVGTTEVVPIIENADLGVVPKRTDGFGNEAFSTKVLEFMALGVPVVVSDSAVDRYYFTDRVVTFFKGNDEVDLADRLLEMIRNTAKREAQVKRADDFIRTFDWDRRKSEYLGLVDTLVQSAKAGASIKGDFPSLRG
jgi:glycosyltransferase involved in cell wall biosynthesis